MVGTVDAPSEKYANGLQIVAPCLGVNDIEFIPSVCNMSSMDFIILMGLT